MTELLIKFARCTETNDIVPPHQASKDLTYSCLKCDKELIVKHGEIRQKHYAHKTECGCDGKICGESEEHKLSKKLLIQNKNHTTFIHTFSCGHSQKFIFSEMKEEFKIDSYRLDVGASVVGVIIKAAIEVYHTHKCGDDKREALREKDILVIELRSEQIIDKYTTCNNDTIFNSDDTKNCNECKKIKEEEEERNLHIEKKRKDDEYIEKKRKDEEDIEKKRKDDEKHNEIIKVGKTKCSNCKTEQYIKYMHRQEGYSYGCKNCFCECGEQKESYECVCSSCEFNSKYKECPDCDKIIEKWKEACPKHVCRCKECNEWTRKEIAIDFRGEYAGINRENSRWGCLDCFTECPGECGKICMVSTIREWKMCFECNQKKREIENREKELKIKEERVKRIKEKEEERDKRIKATKKELEILCRDGKKKCGCDTIILLSDNECTKCLTKRSERKRVHDGAIAVHRRERLDNESVINYYYEPRLYDSCCHDTVLILNKKRKDEIRLRAEQDAAIIKAEQESLRLKAEQDAAIIKAEQELKNKETKKKLCDNRVDELIRRGPTSISISEVEKLINKRIGCEDCYFPHRWCDRCVRCRFLLGHKENLQLVEEKIQKKKMRKQH